MNRRGCNRRAVLDINESFVVRGMNVSQWFSPPKAAGAFLFRIISTIFTLVLAFAAPRESHAAAARPLRIAYLFTSGTMASMWMAKETGGVAQEGVDVEKIFLSSIFPLPAL